MSNVLDERVLSMKFDNKRFNKGIGDTIKKLAGFKDGLDSLEDDSSDFAGGHSSISSGIKSFAGRIAGLAKSFSPVVATIDAAVTKFSELPQIASQMVKSLSVDQISAGMSKFESKTKSVYTISQATGKSVEDVNKSLDNLMWFTDETSYSFADMVSNIGKFTSQGIELDDSIRAMQGIATAAALAGQGTNEASRAMYNFSQALGAGSVKLIDWKSIENANMATKEFKEIFVEEAEKLGTLKNGKTKKGTAVDFKSFTGTLSEGWLTSDVLMAGLQRYGSYAEKLKEYMDANDIDTAAEAMERMGAAGDELGFKAFKAAQQARSFTDAIEATKDAVSSGWLQTFEYVIGDTNEATEVFTDITNALWDFFAASGEARNEVLALWKEAGGRETALSGIKKILEAISNIIDTIKGAFAQLFPAKTAEEWSELLLNFSSSLDKLGDSMLNMFGNKTGLEKRMKETFKMVPNVTETLDESLKKGSEGEGVKKLQERLEAAGYSVGPKAADGIYGKDTEAAVKEFQRAMSLDPTGIVDQKTLDKVLSVTYGSHTEHIEELVNAGAEKIVANVSEPLDEALKKGSEGEGVKKLQERLTELGYDVGNTGVDGILGKNTEAAVKDFQKLAGLEVTGIYDEKTHDEMMKRLYGFHTEYEEVEKIQPSEGLMSIEEVVIGVATAAKQAWDIVSQVFKAGVSIAGSLVKALTPIGVLLKDVAMLFGQTLAGTDGAAESIDLYTKILERAKPVIDAISNAVSYLADGFRILIFGVESVSNEDGSLNFFVKLREYLELLAPLLNLVPKFFKTLSEMGAFTQLSDIWTNIFTRGFEYFTSGDFSKAFAGIKDTVKSAFDTIVAQAKELPIVKALTGVYNVVKAKLVSIRDDIKKRLLTAWKTVTGFFNSTASKFKSAGTSIASSLGKLGEGIEKAASKSEYLTKVRSSLSSFFKTLTDEKFTKRVSNIWEKLLSGGDYVSKGQFSKDVSSLAKTVKDNFLKSFSWVSDTPLAKAFNAIVIVAKNVYNVIRQIFTAVAHIGAMILGTFQPLVDLAKDIYTYLLSLAPPLEENQDKLSVYAKIMAVATPIVNAFGKAVNFVANVLRLLIFGEESLNEEQKSTIANFLSVRNTAIAIKNVFNVLSQVIHGLVTVGSQFLNAFEPLKILLADIFEAIMPKGETQLEELESKTSIYEKILSAATPAINSFAKAIQFAADALRLLIFGQESLDEGQIENVSGLLKIPLTIGNTIRKLKLGDMFSGVFESFGSIKKVLGRIKLGEHFSAIWSGIVGRGSEYFTSGDFSKEVSFIWMNIKAAFASRFDWIKQTPLYQTLEPIFSTIVEKIRNIISWFTNLGSGGSGKSIFAIIKEKISSLFGQKDWSDVSKKLSSLTGKAEKVSGLFEKAKSIFEKVKQAISNFFQSIFGGSSGESSGGLAAVPSGFNILKSGKLANKGPAMMTLGSKLPEVSEGLIGGPDGEKRLTTAIGTAEKTAEKVNIFARIFETVKSIVVGFFSKIKGFFASLFAVQDAADAEGGEGPSMFEMVANKLIEIFGSIVSLVKALQIFMPSYSLISAISARIKAPTKDKAQLLKIAGLILSIGAALVMIAIVIHTLGSMDTGSLIKGLIAFGVILGALTAVVLILGKTQQSDPFSKVPASEAQGKNYMMIAGSFLMMAGAVLIIGYAIKQLGQMDTGVLIKGGLTFTIIMGVMAGFIIAIQKFGGQELKLSGLIEVAVAVGILAAIAWIIGHADFENMLKGLGFIGLIMAELAIFVIAVTRLSGQSSIKFAGFIEIAGAVAILAGVMVILGLIPIRRLIRGAVAIGYLVKLIESLALTAYLISANKVSMTPLLVIAGVISALALVFYGLTLIPVEDAERSMLIMGELAAIVIAIGAVSVAASKLSSPGKMIKSAAAIGAAFALVIGIGVAVMAGLGELNKEGVLASKIEAGGQVLSALVEAILGPFKMAFNDAKAVAGAFLLVEVAGYTATNLLKGAAAIEGVFAIIVGVGTAIMAGLGELNSEGVLAEKIEEGGKVLSTLINSIKGPFKDVFTDMKGIESSFVILEVSGATAGNLIKGAEAISGVFGIMVLVGTAIMDGLGKLNDEGVLVKNIEEGGEVLSALVNSIKGPFKDVFTDMKGIESSFVILEVSGATASNLIKGAAAIEGAFGIMVLVSGAILTGLGSLDEVTDGDLASLISHGGEVLSSIVAAITGPFEGVFTDIKDVEGLFVMTEVAGVAAGGTLLGAAAISGAFTILVGVATAILTGLGELDNVTDGDLVDLINRGGTVLSSVGTAIGKFGGAFKTAFQGSDEAAAQVDSLTLKAISDSGVKSEDLQPALDSMDTVAQFMNKIGGYENLQRESIPGWVTTIFGGEKTAFQTVLSGIAEMVDAFTGETGILASLPGMDAMLENTETNLTDMTKLMDIIAKFMDKIGGYEHLDREQGAVARLFGQETAFKTVLNGIGDMVLAFTVGFAVYNSDGTTTNKTMNDLPFIGATTKNRVSDVLDIMDTIASFMNDLSQYTGLEKEAGELSALFKDKTAFQTVLDGFASTVKLFSSKDFSLPSISEENKTSVKSVVEIMTSLATFMQAVSGMNIEQASDWWTRTFGEGESNFELVLGGIKRSVTLFNDVQTEMETYELGPDFLIQFGAIIAALNQAASLMDRVSRIKLDSDYADYYDILGFISQLSANVSEFGSIIYTDQYDLYAKSLTEVATAYSDISTALSNIVKYVDKKGTLDDIAAYGQQMMTALTVTDEDLGNVSDQVASTFGSAVTSGLTNSDDISTALVSAVMKGQNAVNGTYSSFYSSGRYLAAGLGSGIRKGIIYATSATGDLVAAVLKCIHDGLELGSPSKATARMGRYLDEGLSQGIADGASSTQNESIKTVGGILDGLNLAIAEGIDPTPTIRPVLDLTDVSRSASSLDGYFPNRTIDVSTSARLAHETSSSGNGAKTASADNYSLFAQAINDLRSDMATFKDSIGNLQVVTETGALVGAIGPKMDQYLGRRAMKERRRGI